MTPNILDTIRQRASWRNYLPQPFAGPDREALLDYFRNLPEPPFQTRCRFALVDDLPEAAARMTPLGTYGNIKGAQTFIVGAVKHDAYDLESFGFLFESIILRATQLGLGTCWLGGTFNRGCFAQSIQAQEDETVPAVSPVGAVASERGMRDRFLRWTANSKNRKPWDELFFEDDFHRPLSPGLIGDFQTVLDLVRLAPSASNRQPWRIVRQSGRGAYHFFLQRSSLYGNMAKLFLQTDDLQRIDMGIALNHFQLSAQALQLPGRWMLTDPAVRNIPDQTTYLISWLEK